MPGIACSVPHCLKTFGSSVNPLSRLWWLFTLLQ